VNSIVIEPLLLVLGFPEGVGLGVAGVFVVGDGVNGLKAVGPAVTGGLAMGDCVIGPRVTGAWLVGDCVFCGLVVASVGKAVLQG
jgi:hypothetical protein